MSFQKKPYKKLDLLQLLGKPEDEKIKMQNLCFEALQKEKITPEEYQEMGCCEVTTMKRYLYTLVEDQTVRNLLDRYVVCYSKLHIAGSRVFNAFLCYLESKGLLYDLYDKVIDQTIIKYVILPFKSTIGYKCSSGFKELETFWAEYKHVFEPMYPSKDDLKIVGWDQPLNRIGQAFKTNFITHVCYHFPKRFSGYVEKLTVEKFKLVEDTVLINDTKRKVLKNDKLTIFKTKFYNLINTGKRDLSYVDFDKEVDVSVLPDELVTFVTDIRAEAGLKEKDDVDKIAKNMKLTKEVLKLHVKMSKYFESEETRAFSIGPIAQPKRCFAYVDDRIIESLYRNNMKSQTVPTVKALFQLDHKLWKQKAKDIRKKIRKNKNSRSSRKRLGLGSFPKDKDCIIHSNAF